jgi:hypothetical protein
VIPTYGYGAGSNAGLIACFGYGRRSLIIQLIGRAQRVFEVGFYRSFADKVLKA